MRATPLRPTHNPRCPRRYRRRRALVALAAAPLLLNIQCGDEAIRAFKQSAFPQIETGIKAILDGVVTGVFTLNSADDAEQ